MGMERRVTCVVLVGLCLVVGILCQNVDGRKLTQVKEADVKKPEWLFGDSPIGMGNAGGYSGDGGYGGGMVGGVGGYGGIVGGIVGKGGGIGGGFYKGIGFGGGIGGVGGATLQHVEANNKP